MSEKKPNWSLIAGGVAVAAAIGVVAIYAGGDGGVIMNPKIKQAIDDAAQRDTDGGAASSATPAARFSGSRAEQQALQTGDMVKFVFATDPTDRTGTSFLDATGADRTIGDWQGKTVLVNLWATWCAPCREEMPTLDALQAKLGADDFEVMAISIDSGAPDKPTAMLKELAPQLAYYQDPTLAVRKTLEARGVPTTVLIGPDGKEIGRLTGTADWAAPETVTLLKTVAGLGGSAS